MGNGKQLFPVAKEIVGVDKTPRAVEDVESSFKKNPSWRFSRSDTTHPRWSVMEPHEDVVFDADDPTGTKLVHTFSKSVDHELLEALKPREKMRWSELLTQNGGRGKNGGTNSHSIPVYELIKEAQARVTELGLDTDELLSLRIDGKKRVFGILEGGVLNIVWFDRNHEICPSASK